MEVFDHFFYHWSVYKQIPYTEGLPVNVDKNYVREQKAPKRHLYDLNFFHKVFFSFLVYIYTSCKHFSFLNALILLEKWHSISKLTE